MTDAQLTEHRAAKDRFLRDSPQSPLRPEDRPGFDGLPYFDEDPTLRFVVRPDDVEPTAVVIGTTIGDERTYERVATVTIELAGTSHRLALFSTGHPGYFLPFRDETSGDETYGAGRYLDLSPNPDGSVTVDFNYAYAPFCAYNDAYSCALPPPENWLDTPIRAGERTPIE